MSIYNPLNDIQQPQPKSESNEQMVSVSALSNDIYGQCPKCKKQMGQARLAGNETVYYCKTCRVSSPIEISE